MNFLQKITDAYGKIAWKENENARKRTQLEYEIVRQLANDMFEQAQVVYFVVYFAYFKYVLIIKIINLKFR